MEPPSTPGRTRRVAALLEQGAVREAMDRVTPSELFLIAREIGAKRGQESSCVLAELKQMATAAPGQLTWAAVSSGPKDSRVMPMPSKDRRRSSLKRPVARARSSPSAACPNEPSRLSAGITSGRKR